MCLTHFEQACGKAKTVFYTIPRNLAVADNVPKFGTLNDFKKCWALPGR